METLPLVEPYSRDICCCIRGVSVLFSTFMEPTHRHLLCHSKLPCFAADTTITDASMDLSPRARNIFIHCESANLHPGTRLSPRSLVLLSDFVFLKVTTDLHCFASSGSHPSDRG